MDLNKGQDACAWVAQRLEAHLDGALPETEADRLRAHINSCAICRAEERLASRLAVELADLPAFDAPDATIEKVLEEARTERRAAWGRTLRDWLQPAWRPSLALTACLALFFAVQPPPTPGPSAAEIAAAEQQARLALAYIGRASRRAGLTVRHQVIADGIVAPVERQARAAFEPEKTM